MPIEIPTIRLADGHEMPQLGFGVWQVENDEVGKPVRVALESGYRLIDTAEGYGNEAGVGEAIAGSGVARDDVVLTTKLNNPRHGYGEAIEACHESLERLGTDYLDLYLIHWPLPMYDDYVDTWKAFIRLREEGKVRSIGVSNFLPEHIDRLIAETGTLPVINQIELHPEFQQREVRTYHADRGIHIEAYSPLGSGAVLDNPAIASIAEARGRSPAQVILRWHMQEGTIAIPKSVTPERIEANLDLFDFELDSDDMAAIEALDKGEAGRTGSDPATFDWRG